MITRKRQTTLTPKMESQNTSGIPSLKNPSSFKKIFYLKCHVAESDQFT